MCKIAIPIISFKLLYKFKLQINSCINSNLFGMSPLLKLDIMHSKRKLLDLFLSDNFGLQSADQSPSKF